MVDHVTMRWKAPIDTKPHAPERGIRDFAAVHALAQGIALELVVDIPMPAYNRCLVWRRASRFRR